jgi:hypothetical protein
MEWNATTYTYARNDHVRKLYGSYSWIAICGYVHAWSACMASDSSMQFIYILHDYSLYMQTIIHNSCLGKTKNIIIYYFFILLM